MNSILTFLPSGLENVLLLVTALSIDVFFTGFSYGSGSIQIPFFSSVIISGISVVFLSLSLSLGQLAASFSSAASLLGGIILFILGIMRLRKSLFLSHQIQHADSDHNGVLSPRESFSLGTALALDCIAAGVGAGTASYPLPACAIFSFCGCLIALYAGFCCGKWITQLGRWNLAPLGGVILILLALRQIL